MDPVVPVTQEARGPPPTYAQALQKRSLPTTIAVDTATERIKEAAAKIDALKPELAEAAKDEHEAWKAYLKATNKSRGISVQITKNKKIIREACEQIQDEFGI